MKLLPVALLLLALLGCSRAESDASEPGTTTKPPEQSVSTVSTAQPDREALIYAAVIRQLATKDHTFGGANPGFKVIYVMDGVVEAAEDPNEPLSRHGSARPFSHDLKDEVRFLSGLADLPPVEFVPERDAVVAGNESGSLPGHVKNGGVLISLGPIEGDGNRVEVGNSLWINGLAGQWLTYVLEHRNGDWRITGTTGPAAIS